MTSYSYFGLRLFAPVQQPMIELLQLRILIDSFVTGLHQQQPQQTRAGFADAPKLLSFSAGIFTRFQPDLSCDLAAIGKATHR